MDIARKENELLVEMASVFVRFSMGECFDGVPFTVQNNAESIFMEYFMNCVMFFMDL